ncbi:hypothetical protein ACFLS1_10610 [Verrucomicrobiota bacterium]
MDFLFPIRSNPGHLAPGGACGQKEKIHHGVMTIIFILVFFFFAGCAIAANIFYRKNLHCWLPYYVRDKIISGKKQVEPGQGIDIFLCIADHFEPGYAEAPIEKQRKRMDRWMEEFPLLASRHRDFDGRPPRHTWFFPPHYDLDDHLGRLVGLCDRGLGEVELHFHHNRVDPYPDTEETFKIKIKNAIKSYSRFGIFPHKDNLPCFAFIHGDWALDNSRGDEFCGINNEIELLSELGCYADFTYPCQFESQPKKVNSIYYAEDDPQKPKSHDTGIEVEAGGRESGHIMIIQGILGLRFVKRPRSLFLAIEDCGISNSNPPSKERIDFWVRNAISVKGRPDIKFIKLHTHGAWEGCMDALLGPQAEDMYDYLDEKYNDGKKYRLHYVTAREMYNVIKAVEADKKGDISDYTDFVIPGPVYKR